MSGEEEKNGTPAAGAQRTQTNAKAIVALVLGACGVLVVPVLASIPAVIFGHIARNEIKESGERGDELALIGLVLGWVMIALAALAVFVLLILIVFGTTVAAS